MKKRLNGINEIKNIIEQTSDNRHRQSWQDDDSPRRSRWLKPEFLLNWIHENKLTELLLGESSHIEVIKRSACVLRFLSYHNQLTKEHLDLLWKCQEGKHEATVLGVFETIIEIAMYLSSESLNYIFSKIQEIPLKKYNEQVLNFVKDFTVNACDVLRASKKTELITVDSDDEEESKIQDYYLENVKAIIEGEKQTPIDIKDQYGIPIIWELCLQPTELGSLALKSLIELLKSKCCSIYKMEYIMKCIVNLQNNVSVYQSLTIISSVINKRFSHKRLGNNRLQQILVC
jgi:hypothetical protein